MRSKLVPDPKIVQSVNRRLASSGIRAPARVDVRSVGGTVTLAGFIQYEHQRQAANQAAQGAEGVRRVVDQLQLKPAVKRT